MRVLPPTGVEMRQLREFTSGLGNDVKGPVDLPSQDDSAILPPARADGDRRYRRERNGGPARERYLPQLRAREKSDPLSVGREERRRGPLGPRDELRGAAAQGAPEQRPAALVDALEDDRLAIRRNGKGGTKDADAFGRRERQNGVDDRRNGVRRRGHAQKEHGGAGDRRPEQRSPDCPRETAARAWRTASRRRGSRCGCCLRFLDFDAGVGDVVEATLRVLLQAPAKKLADGGGRLFRQKGPIGLRAQDRRKGVGHGFARKRLPARQALVEHAAEGEDVGAFVERLAARLLRAHVGRGSEDRAGVRRRSRDGRGKRRVDRASGRFRDPRESEVEHFDGTVGPDLDVGWLQVPMDDARFVRRLQARRDAGGDRKSLVDRQRSGGEPFGERRPLDELHDEEARFSLILEAIDGGNIGVIESGQEPRLALEAEKPFRVLRNGIRKGLQRNVPMEFRVARPVHLAHAAPPDRSDDLVGADATADLERHGFPGEKSIVWTHERVRDERTPQIVRRSRTGCRGPVRHDREAPLRFLGPAVTHRHELLPVGGDVVLAVSVFAPPGGELGREEKPGR